MKSLLLLAVPTAACVVPVLPNPHYAPSALDLLSGTALKYGLIQNAADYPLLKASVRAAIPLLTKSTRKKHRVNRTRIVQRGLLGLDLGIGLSTDVDIAGLLGIEAGLLADVSTLTVVDHGWNDCKTTKLTNSQNDNAVRFTC